MVYLCPQWLQTQLVWPVPRERKALRGQGLVWGQLAQRKWMAGVKRRFHLVRPMHGRQRAPTSSDLFPTPECPLHHNRTLCASLLRTSLALRLCVLRAGSAWEFPSLLGTALSQWLLVGEYKYPHFFI